MTENQTASLPPQPPAERQRESKTPDSSHLSTFGLWIIILALLLSAWLSSLALGSVSIPVSDVVGILVGKSSSHLSWNAIVLDFRLPKSLTALLAGAALSVAGLQMQTLFRNPLADPYVLGISSGASMGVAFVILAAGQQRLALSVGPQ